jgi:hypothetical protein
MLGAALVLRVGGVWDRLCCSSTPPPPLLHIFTYRYMRFNKDAGTETLYLHLKSIVITAEMSSSISRQLQDMGFAADKVTLTTKLLS